MRFAHTNIAARDWKSLGCKRLEVTCRFLYRSLFQKVSSKRLEEVKDALVSMMQSVKDKIS